MKRLLLIAAAGAAGALCRYVLGGLVHAVLGRDFPYGTAAANLLGCFLFGLVFALSEERGLVRPEWRLVLLVGFLGAFTTFSSLVFETSELMRDAQWLKAAANLLGQNVLGFAALWLGYAGARVL